jgi:hypothetical protein
MTTLPRQAPNSGDVNLAYTVMPETFADFVDLVVPELHGAIRPPRGPKVQPHSCAYPPLRA